MSVCVHVCVGGMDACVVDVCVWMHVCSGS